MGYQDNVTASLQLLESIALPILTYSIEALSLNKTQLIELDHPWLRSCMKIFLTFDTNIVRQCQACACVLPIAHYYAIHCMTFWTKYSRPALLSTVYSSNKCKDISNLAKRYQCSNEKFINQFKNVLNDVFKDETFSII